AVVNKYGDVTGEVVAQSGQYRLELPPSTDNTDPRYPDLYLVGGDPYLLVEQVEPLPDTVAAPLEVVWPHDGAPITQASAAHLTALVLDARSDRPIPCRWSPTVRLMASVDGGTAREVATGTRRLVSENGVTYPVWDFNNVDVSAATRGAE